MYIGIDYGTKKVGVALSDEDDTLAFPYNVFETSASSQQVIELARQRQASGIVIGESLNRDGTPNPVHEQAVRFADKLSEALGVPVRFEPEFYSTKEAERLRADKGVVDASAAAVILQSFLDKHTQDD